jgi:hypothetical protein
MLGVVGQLKRYVFVRGFGFEFACYFYRVFCFLFLTWLVQHFMEFHREIGCFFLFVGVCLVFRFLGSNVWLLDLG